MDVKACRATVVGVLLAAANGAAHAASDDPIKGMPETGKQPPAPLKTMPTPAQPGGFILPPVSGASQGSGIQVAGYRFQGNTVFSNEELQKIAAPYAGRRISPAELEELRTRITRLYVDAGYINSGALLAALPSKNGYPDNIVPFHIVEGHVDEVRIKGEERLQKSYIESRLIKNGEVLNVNAMQERFRLLLTDPLFDRINSRIIPGDAPGKAVLDIDVVRAKPYSLSLFANNYRPPSIGSNAAGVSGWVRNLTGYGDMLEASVQHSQGADPFHAGWSVPVGAAGTSFHASYDNGSSSVIEEPLNTIDIRSVTSGYEIGVDQSLIDTLARKVEVGLSYGQRDNKTTVGGTPFSFTPGEPNGDSRVKVWRLSQDWTERWEKQALALRSVFAFGRNNVDPTGATGPVADQSYRIWTGQAQYVQNVLDNGSQILLRASVQLTPDLLLPLERLSLGGVGTVRGYRENAVVRDEGYAMSAEFHYPLLGSGEANNSLTLIGFVDYGNGWNRGEDSQKLSSAGLGLNWRWQGWSADLYWAKKLSSLPVETSGNLQDKGIHFQISYSLF
jgi:hemolysin activation/secretion protein